MIQRKYREGRNSPRQRRWLRYELDADDGSVPTEHHMFPPDPVPAEGRIAVSRVLRHACDRGPRREVPLEVSAPA